MVQKNKLAASIIIRGKNEARWLKILLPILKKQSLKNFEIIFCDNNSAGKKIIDITIIPKKKTIEKIKFLNIIFNVTLNQIFFVFYPKF